MKGILYILKFKDSGKYYVGSTSDLNRRLNQHKEGHTFTTKKFGNFNLVFSQEFNTVIEARRIERKIKSWKRRDFIDKIINDNIVKTT